MVGGVHARAEPATRSGSLRGLGATWETLADEPLCCRAKTARTINPTRVFPPSATVTQNAAWRLTDEISPKRPMAVKRVVVERRILRRRAATSSFVYDTSFSLRSAMRCCFAISRAESSARISSVVSFVSARSLRVCPRRAALRSVARYSLRRIQMGTKYTSHSAAATKSSRAVPENGVSTPFRLKVGVHSSPHPATSACSARWKVDGIAHLHLHKLGDVRDT